MTTIVLPVRCNRAVAEEMLPEMLAALEFGPLEIDASGVEQIGQAMLQLLVSARCTGDGAVILGSAALTRNARLAGLSDTLFGDAQ